MPVLRVEFCGEFSATDPVSGVDDTLCGNKRLHHVSKTPGGVWRIAVDSRELENAASGWDSNS